MSCSLWCGSGRCVSQGVHILIKIPAFAGMTEGGAGRTGSAGTAPSAGMTGSAGTATSAGMTGSAGTAMSAGMTGSAGTAMSAGMTGSAGTVLRQQEMDFSIVHNV